MTPRTRSSRGAGSAPRFAAAITILLCGACSSASLAAQDAAPAGRPAPADTAVLTQKNEPTRTGWNAHETVLNQSTLDPAHFGRRTSYPVDGAIYAQPLFVPGLTVDGGTHNAAIVATEHDSVYAFDTDATGQAHAPLWRRSLLPQGARPVSAEHDVTCAAISPEVGVTGTPVIDPATRTLYVVATTREDKDIVYRVYALDLDTGRDRVAPALIEAAAPGTATDATDGRLTFTPRFEQQRMGLLLLGGVVYVSFASYCDEDPSHGWILGYRASDLGRAIVYIDSPDAGSSGKRAGGGGLWESQTGLTADAAGSIYVVTGNGPFDLDTGGANGGNSLLRLVPDGGTLRLADYFAPFDQACLNDHDQDLGSGAPLLLPGAGELLFVGKDGRFYVTSTARLGGHQVVDQPCGAARSRTDVDLITQESPNQTVQGGVWGSETAWTGGGHTYVYTAGVADHLAAWELVGGRVVLSATAQAPEELAYPGGIPVLSSDGDRPGTAILWLVGQESGGPALRAYDPADVSRELYGSEQRPARDRLGSYTNFTVPTVAAGRVLVGTKQTLDVFGPLP
ncbi:hypothetical protein F0L68_28250 [Solihabitans fulvus]|uniref:Uncharacterized protein n=1 Tax=Solihabitans fulvus TaxID=1892852 RepID=A0A5B2WUL8_9PSEU|nr:hypothetical protein [Solihabitans fulvus]KAA2255461.1 hypothetical protein F0L68_28250 [Solihabitans fulvus]